MIFGCHCEPACGRQALRSNLLVIITISLKIASSCLLAMTLTMGFPVFVSLRAQRSNLYAIKRNEIASSYLLAMTNTTKHYPFVQNCQLSTVNCQLSTVNYQLSIVNCQLSTINC
jgi:hypothetical protein